MHLKREEEDHALTAATPTAAELLEQLRALHGDAFADSLASLCAEGPETAASSPLPDVLPSSPEGYWHRAEALVRPLQRRLGTLYGPLVAIYTLALLHLEEGKSSSTFVAPLWIVGALCGLSRDRVDELLTEHAEVASKFVYRRAWATKYSPIGKEREACARWAGQLFLVPIPCAPLDEDVIFAPRVKGVKALFSARCYRDLALDVHRRFTEAGWKEKHLPVRARYGQARNPGLPSGPRLALLEQLVADRFGHGALHRAREREALKLLTVHDVLHALNEGPRPGKDGVGAWARSVAEGLSILLGDPARTKVWLSACWAAWRVTRSGLANGFDLLYQGVFEVLIRRQDQPWKSASSRGRALNWILNSLGLRRLDRHARRLTLPLAA